MPMSAPAKYLVSTKAGVKGYEPMPVGSTPIKRWSIVGLPAIKTSSICAPVRKKSASSTIDPSKLRRVSEVSGTRDSSSATLDLQVGQRVRHERFGVGEVLSLEGSGGDARAIIRFEDVGEKKMLLKFAKIQKI